MTQTKDGDTVRIHYKGTLTDGTVFDSSEGRDPLEFTIGSGQVIPGLDKAIQQNAFHGPALLDRGVALFRLKRYELALDSLNSAVKSGHQHAGRGSRLQHPHRKPPRCRRGHRTPAGSHDVQRADHALRVEIGG